MDSAPPVSDMLTISPLSWATTDNIGKIEFCWGQFYHQSLGSPTKVREDCIQGTYNLGRKRWYKQGLFPSTFRELTKEKNWAIYSQETLHNSKKKVKVELVNDFFEIELPLGFKIPKEYMTWALVLLMLTSLIYLSIEVYHSSIFAKFRKIQSATIILFSMVGESDRLS
jgi:hypothetical protein